MDSPVLNEAATMTLAKLLRILDRLRERNGNLPSGSIGTTCGGELELSFHGQPAREEHEFLLSRGFIQNEERIYIYRPYRREKK